VRHTEVITKAEDKLRDSGIPGPYKMQHSLWWGKYLVYKVESSIET
jgi:hypothetical protein